MSLGFADGPYIISRLHVTFLIGRMAIWRLLFGTLNNNNALKKGPVKDIVIYVFFIVHI